jgi:hypothetical protein
MLRVAIARAISAPGDWDPAALADAVRAGRQKKIKLAKALPVAWAFLLS